MMKRVVVFEELKSLNPEIGTDLGGLCTLDLGIWSSCSRSQRGTELFVADIT